MKTKYSYVGKYSDGGSQNSFYKLKGRKNKGFKSFPNKSLATFARAVQDDLSKTNLAPRVYSPVCRIRVPNYFMGQNGEIETHMVLSDWGYITEVALPFRCSSDDCDGDCANCDTCFHYEKIGELLEAIEHYGLSYIDAHPANLGYIIRGGDIMVVVVDLGAESITDEGGTYPDVCWDGAEDCDCSCEQCRERYANA